RIQPFGTNDGQHGIARCHLAAQIVLEVPSDRDVVDIHEQLVFAERFGHPIVQPTGHTARFIPAVTDENVASHAASPEKAPTPYRRTGQSTMNLLTMGRANLCFLWPVASV